MAASLDSLAGEWTNVEPETMGITRLTLTIDGGGGLCLDVWARCRPIECHWGRSVAFPVRFQNDHLFAYWKDTYSLKLQVLSKHPGGRLRLITQSRFRKGPEKEPVVYVEYFTRKD